MNVEFGIRNAELNGRYSTTRRSFIIHNSAFRIPAFTLVELMVVITLMSIVVGMTVFRLDDVTTSGRLRSAASRIASVIRLAQSEARTSGSPRQLEYSMHEDHFVIRKPLLNQGHWQWDNGRDVALSAHIDRILKENEEKSTKSSFLIGSDGRYQNHAVVLNCHEQWCVMVLRGMQEPHIVFLSHLPQADSFETMITELESEHAKS